MPAPSACSSWRYSFCKTFFFLRAILSLSKSWTKWMYDEFSIISLTRSKNPFLEALNYLCGIEQRQNSNCGLDSRTAQGYQLATQSLSILAFTQRWAGPLWRCRVSNFQKWTTGCWRQNLASVLKWSVAELGFSHRWVRMLLLLFSFARREMPAVHL